MRTRKFQLTGLMPLLMHKSSIEGADQLQAWRKDPKNKNMSTPGDDRTPPWTWHTYLYHDGDHIAMESQNIMVCIRQAAVNIILKRQKTFKELSQSGMLIPTETCQFTIGGSEISMGDIEAMRNDDFTKQADKARKLGFRLFCKRARVGQAKHIRVRPRFDRWEITGELNIFAKEITDPILTEMLAMAGRGGLCDWRPGCTTPGPFGMFEAKLI